MSGNQVEDYTTQNCLEFHQDADNGIIIDRSWSVSGIVHTILGIVVFCKVHIKPDLASESTNGDIRCM